MNGGVYGGLFVGGLLMSLHCVGMCGPILASFAEVFNRSSKPRPSDFVWYHVGRIWTYALLGFVAGWVGAGVRLVAGGQRIGGTILGLLVVASALALAGWIPGVRLEALVSGCALDRWRGWSWFSQLLRTPGRTARLLLGVVLGFLPCGLVYAMLATVAALPTPWHAALGMIVFGLGTLPSLTAVLLASHWLGARWRAHGTRVAAALLLVSGLWMVGRAWTGASHSHPAPEAAEHEHEH